MNCKGTAGVAKCKRKTVFEGGEFEQSAMACFALIARLGKVYISEALRKAAVHLKHPVGKHVAKRLLE